MTWNTSIPDGLTKGPEKNIEVKHNRIFKYISNDNSKI